MADHSLSQVYGDSHYYISIHNLENLHFKIDQSYSMLSIFTDWIMEDCCSLRIEDKERVVSFCFLLMDLLKAAGVLLPDV